MPNVSRRLYPNLPNELKRWSCPHDFTAQVNKVSDGDTVHVTIQLGFGILLPEVRVRLLGIDAPELKGTDKYLGVEAKRQLSKLVLDKWIGLETHAEQTCKYGRWLGVLWLPTDGHLLNVNQWMVQNNFAKTLKVNRSFDATDAHHRPLMIECPKCKSFT